MPKSAPPPLHGRRRQRHFFFLLSDTHGLDCITDFQGGAGVGDVLNLTGVAGLNTFADVQARM